MNTRALLPVVAALALTGAGLQAQDAPRPPGPAGTSVRSAPVDPRLAAIKAAVVADVTSPALFDLGQQMTDMVFSFSELGFQEYETQKYLTGILEKEGFRIERGYAGIPTMWVARWGSGSPVIALGSDVDCIPQGSQKPGVAYHDPIIDGAPGHGEGHNSGTPLNIVAAIAAKRQMEKAKLPGTLVIWPGIAEEVVGTKAYYIRAGLFTDVDVVLYNHVGSALETSWGEREGTGLVSVEYTFEGETAHSAGAPWRGKSALDAVELMNAGWNVRREHLRLQHRSHYVITNGGDQPNVVPRRASVWYYFRETDYDRIKGLWEIGDNIARGAALMTDTTWTSRVLGSAWPQHFNKPLSETMHQNITAVGLPQWTDADVTLAKATQQELGVPVVGLTTKIGELKGQHAIPEDERRGGGSDDIGDISWTVPTVSLRFPANFQAGPGHNWANAISMATPIAHKGVNHGAQVVATTVIDVLLRPDVVTAAKAYFTDVQTKDRKYQPLLRETDTPAIELNAGVMEKFKPELRKYYYDPTRYKTYLEQLGIEYPTVRKAETKATPE